MRFRARSVANLAKIFLVPMSFQAKTSSSSLSVKRGAMARTKKESGKAKYASRGWEATCDEKQKNAAERDVRECKISVPRV